MLSRFQHFTTSVFSIHKQIQKIQRDEMKQLGLKGSYAQYLLAINYYGDRITSTKLCEICDKDKAAISRVVAEMEENGLIFRQMQGEKRYRAALLLTEKGREVTARLCERAKLAIDAAGKGLSNENREILHASLGLIAENLQKISQNGIPEGEK